MFATSLFCTLFDKQEDVLSFNNQLNEIVSYKENIFPSNNNYINNYKRKDR
jgi:hypothetical protein